jgi:hypothetical protein
LDLVLQVDTDRRALLVVKDELTVLTGKFPCMGNLT